MGIYGERGWTTHNKVRDILRGLCDGDDASEQFADYEQFEGVTGETAQRLKAALPQACLDDRQNWGPTLESMLNAAIAHPGVVFLDGYVIGPGRPDERVSADTLRWRGELDYNVTDFHDEGCECGEAWAWLNVELGLESAEDTPDEFSRVAGRDGVAEWRLWWD